MSALIAGPRATAVLLVTGAAAEVVEGLLSPLGNGSTASNLAEISAHEAAFAVSVTFGLVATILYAPGFLGLAAACETAAPRLARVAEWVALASMGGFLAVRMVQAIELAGVREGLPRAAFARTIDHGASTPMGAIILAMFLLGSLVGLVLLAVAGWRAGLPRAACVLLGLFGVVDLALPTGPVPVSHLLLLVAVTWLGSALWRRAAASGGLASDLSVAPAAADVG